jgi:hypothetical protein
MTCSEVRHAIGADPQGTNAALAAHLRDCAGCSAYQREMLELDARIARALALPVTLAAPARAAPRWNTPQPLALAASLLLVVGVGLATFVTQSGNALASQIVAHVAHGDEPMDWAPLRPVPSAAVTYALRRSGVQLDGLAGEVVYAQSCWFRNHFVPHLIVRTPRGDVTVLLLTEEHVWKKRRFAQDGLKGILVPAQRGSIAVLSQADADVGAIAARVATATHWQ